MRNYRLPFHTFSDAGSRKIADIKTFRGLMAGDDNPLTLTFSKEFIESLYESRKMILEVTETQLGRIMFHYSTGIETSPGWYIGCSDIEVISPVTTTSIRSIANV